MVTTQAPRCCALSAALLPWAYSPVIYVSFNAHTNGALCTHRHSASALLSHY